MISALRHHLTLEQAFRTGDEGGGASLSWVAVTTLWASVEAVGGGEREAADRSEARTRYKIRLRYRADVTAGMRFRQDTQLFNICTVQDEEGRRRWLTCACEEGGAS